MTNKKSTSLDSVDSSKAIVPEIIDATHGAETPFGKRCGGDVFKLTDADLEALKNGKILALDVQNEYVVFLKGEERGE